jgi:hypothetical protein
MSDLVSFVYRSLPTDLPRHSLNMVLAMESADEHTDTAELLEKLPE